MDIIYLGHSSFRLKGKSSTVVTDPYDSSVGFKFPKVEANIVTVSHDHGDHNSVEQIDPTASSGQEVKVILDPGEYEIGGVSIFGIPTFHDNKQGEERGRNTIYVILIDGVVICHLGDLGHKLSEDQIEAIGQIDVLLVPVGGFYSLGASEAVEVITSLEPKIVIPMHYKIDGLDKSLAEKLAPVEDFLKEIGVEPVRDNKLTVAPDKFSEEMQVVVLERKG